MHFPVSLHSVFSYCNGPNIWRRSFLLPPAKKGDTDVGAFPETKMFTTPLREAQIDVCG